MSGLECSALEVCVLERCLLKETPASKRCLPKQIVSTYEQFLSEGYSLKASVCLPERPT